MTLPRLTVILKQQKARPPLHVLVGRLCAYFGLENQSSQPAEWQSEEESQDAFIAAAMALNGGA